MFYPGSTLPLPCHLKRKLNVTYNLCNDLLIFFLFSFLQQNAFVIERNNDRRKIVVALLLRCIFINRIELFNRVRHYHSNRCKSIRFSFNLVIFYNFFFSSEKLRDGYAVAVTTIANAASILINIFIG